MASLSKQVQARLRALADTFASQLPERMREIAESAKVSLQDLEDREAMKTLWNNVHRLAGSAATFGFHKITVCAKRLEHLLDGVIHNGESVDDRFRRTVRMLVSELAEATEARHTDRGGEHEGWSTQTDEAIGVADFQDETSGTAILLEAEVADEADRDLRDRAERPPAGAELREPVVALMLPASEWTEALGEELGLYGFQTAVLDSVDSLAELTETGGPIAAVIDFSYLRAPEANVERLGVLGRTAAGQLHLVYVSGADGYAERLLAVRAGGSAFLTSPVDTHRVLDTVDGLVSAGAREPYHVMIVDDDLEQVSYHALILQQAGMITSVVSDPQHMFNVLIESKPELILMDMYMPECSGQELASIVRQQEAFVSVPIVFLSVETDRERQIEATSRGGDGFLAKPVKPDHLIATVRNRVERYRSMRFFMERDSLTGLLNHTHLIQALSKEVQRAERVRRSLCFAMIDLDRFKRINDRHGHLTGDRVLKSLARHLVDRLRKTDVVGRYGGEEFGVVLFNVDLENATRIMDQIRIEFSQIEHEANSTTFTCTFSCGIAGYPDYDGPGPISEAADRALYAAKQGGRNRVINV
jgi:diguanylate cyclase (GGDEF)-like protein